VLGELEQFLTRWLGNASAFGAASWLQAFTWVATLVAAFIAGLALRRNSLQSRATLLLTLYKSWEELAPQRREFLAFFTATQQDVRQRHSSLQEKYQIEKMREEFQKKLAALRDQSDNQMFLQFTAYVGFFEVLGMYVKNGYLPLRDVIQIYKGPILAIDIVWRDFIKTWEKEAQVAPGLLEHAIFLMDATRTRSNHPVYYWTIHRFRRYF
jgi:hypothetical protein